MKCCESAINGHLRSIRLPQIYGLKSGKSLSDGLCGAQEIIAKTESDKAMMVEQRQQLEEDVAKWEKKFRKKKGREPDEADRWEGVNRLTLIWRTKLF